MERTGIVVNCKDHMCEIQLLRHTACGKCGACQLGDENKNVMIKAQNNKGADVGETVIVGMPTQSILGAAFIMYIIPLLAFVLGLTLGYFVLTDHLHQELFSALMGIILMAITFFIIKSQEKRFLKSQRYTAQILSVVKDLPEDFIIKK